MADRDAADARADMSALYRNAVCLAPMVRAGTLPLRLLSLRYGADLVYGEEIIDKRIIATTRVENAVLNTVDYVSKNGDSVVFRTCAEEKAKVVFQIGTADAQLALRAAQHVQQDVAAIDVNMGCPKHFSIQGGMGAGLLKNQQLACDIVRTLSANLTVPVSAKIRLLETTEATIAFAKALQEAGAAAIGLHARYTSERPVDSPHWDLLRPVVEALDVPVLVNGDIFTREALAEMRAASGASSFLLARGAMANASVFRSEGMLPYTDVVVEFLKVAAETDNVFQNTKYTLSRMLPGKCDAQNAQAIVTVADLYAVKSNEQMFALWGQRHVYDEWQEVFRTRADALDAQAMPPAPQQPSHTYDDAHVLARQFYCDVCAVQMLSDQDVALHVNGKRHKNKLKRQAAAALSEHVARVEDEQQQGQDEPAAKRAKVEEGSESATEVQSPTDSAAISVTAVDEIAGATPLSS